MSKYIDLALASFADVRIASVDGRPDASDCHDVADAQFRAIQDNFRAFREGRLVIHDPSAVAGNYTNFNPRTGALASSRGPQVGSSQAGFNSSNVQSPFCPPQSRDGGTPQASSDCAPIVHCGATPLPFNTFESSDYPLAGVTVGTIAEGEFVQYTSGRADKYQALWLYFSARDTAASFAKVQGFITQAEVNANSQLAGDSLTNRPIASDIYDNVGPVMLDNWREWGNVAPQVLKMKFGHALGSTAEVAFVGSFFGQATMSSGR